MKRVFSLILLMVAIAACKTDNKPDSDNSADNKGIKRYEVDLFSIDTSRFEEGIKHIFPEYKVFLGDQLPDQVGMEQLRAFVTDPQVRATYQYTMQKFPDLKWLNKGLDDAFTIYSQEFPNKQVPQVYTYISGFDIQMPVKYADSVLIIGLDLYLGKDYKTYLELGYPVYIVNRLTPEYILSDCFREIGWANITQNKTTTLLDAMIEEGKTIYFAKVMLPDEKDENLIKYNPEQMKWVQENEQNLWSFIIENQLLYSTDANALTTFMTDGPFTSGFSNNSPSRTGQWLGYQIVKAYMDRGNVSLQELLKETDSQKILQESGYKPAKK
ncbi:MAG: DUF2268 domain-containing putative Zn-dependent protease [Lentimicrobiaceae bacterium]